MTRSSAHYPSLHPDTIAAIKDRSASLQADVSLQDKVHAIARSMGPGRSDEQRLLATAAAASTPVQQIRWFRRAADRVVSAATGVAACKAGCAHCCYIAVLLTEREARVIAKETGRQLREPAPGESIRLTQVIEPDALDQAMVGLAEFQDRESARHMAIPCPFLHVDPDGPVGNGRCVIYSSRPLTCRQLINLDRDDFLCHLLPGEAISVPYLDMRLHAAAQLETFGRGQRVADIRSWFE